MRVFVPDTPPKMEAHQVPKGTGSLGLPKKYAGPYPGGGTMLQPSYGLIFGGADRAETYCTGLVVERLDQQQEGDPSRYARDPEGPFEA